MRRQWEVWLGFCFYRVIELAPEEWDEGVVVFTVRFVHLPSGLRSDFGC